MDFLINPDHALPVRTIVLAMAVGLLITLLPQPKPVAACGETVPRPAAQAATRAGLRVFFFFDLWRLPRYILHPVSGREQALAPVPKSGGCGPAAAWPV